MKFPWRLYLRYAVIPVGLIFPLLWIGGRPSVKESALFLVFAAIWLWSARRLFSPLGRLVAWASKSGEIDGLSPRDLQHEDASEWTELETALTRMRTDLRGKNAELNKEREEIGVLMSAISDAILAVDQGERVLFSNSKFKSQFSAHSDHLVELFRSPEVLDLFRAALASGAAMRGEFHQERYFSIQVAPLKASDGVIYGAVGVFHDVSDLKLAERVRIDFVANVSHELRTPLTAIKGYTDTLTADARAGRFDSIADFTEVIARNVDRLMALVADLLDLSSLESGDELKKSMISTDAITQRVIRQMSDRANAKGVQIHTRVSAPQVLADERRVEQVLVNLLDNAIKYAGPKSAIWIEWSEGADSKVGRVVLSVRDNGPGIPAESIPRIFERFYRVDQARSREIGGTGLGLSIVKHIMQRHGGSVRVSSELGKGCEFICEFPPLFGT